MAAPALLAALLCLALSNPYTKAAENWAAKLEKEGRGERAEGGQKGAPVKRALRLLCLLGKTGRGRAGMRGLGGGVR